MRDFVIAMAHVLVAEPHRDEELALNLSGPQLHIRRVRVEPPRMVAAFLDAAFDCPLQIDAPVFRLPNLSCDDAKAQPPSRADAFLKMHPCVECILDERSFACRCANPI